jgi:hypothetical protein
LLEAIIAIQAENIYYQALAVGQSACCAHILPIKEGATIPLAWAYAGGLIRFLERLLSRARQN